MTKESSMKPANPRILIINGGSSSIQFALDQTGGPLERRLYGKVDRIGRNSWINNRYRRQLIDEAKNTLR